MPKAVQLILDLEPGVQETPEERRKRKNQAAAAKWYAANKERAKANVRARYKAKRDEIRAWHKGYAAANKERIRAREAKWRAVNKPRMAALSVRWRKANRAEILAKKKVYAAANKDRIAVANKAWNDANKDHVAAMNAAWRAANPERAKARSAKWRAANAERRQVLAENYRSRKLGAVGAYDLDQVSALFKQQSGLCAYCTTSIADGYHADHIIPLTKGGTNWIENIALACQRCNLSKKNNLVDEWQRKLARRKKAALAKANKADRPGVPPPQAVPCLPCTEAEMGLHSRA